MKPIFVHITEQVNFSANAHWDGEESTVSCTVEYAPTSAPDAPTLSELLDKRLFNIRESGYLITGGFFSMALDPQRRIVDWSIYTNPSQWIRGAREFEEAVPANAFLDAEFDENGRASIGEPTEFYEPKRGAFYLSWGESSTWYGIAPGVALGVTAERHLAELRLDGLSMPEAEQKVERLSLWKKLRQLI